MAGKWNEIRDDVQRKWGRLTNSDLDASQGQINKLVDTVQKKYGYSASKARREVNKFLNQYGMSTGDIQDQASDMFTKVRKSVNQYPWAFIAGALVLGLVVVGFVYKPFDNANTFGRGFDQPFNR